MRFTMIAVALAALAGCECRVPKVMCGEDNQRYVLDGGMWVTTGERCIPATEVPQ
jgi:hypothetical protein